MSFKQTARNKKLLITLAAGILGNLLAYLSSLLVNLHPQITFDFSHLATFSIAIVFGPAYGLVAGCIGSIYPYINYAVLGIYGPLFGLAIIFGKAMTGFVCGMLRNRMKNYLAINISYIPESLFTLSFLFIMHYLISDGRVSWAFIYSVISEGWVEVIIFSLIIDYIMRRKAIEAAVLVFEIFIMMFLVHKEFINTLLVLLLITLTTLILFEIIELVTNKDYTDESDDEDE